MRNGEQVDVYSKPLAVVDGAAVVVVVVVVVVVERRGGRRGRLTGLLLLTLSQRLGVSPLAKVMESRHRPMSAWLYCLARLRSINLNAAQSNPFKRLCTPTVTL